MKYVYADKKITKIIFISTFHTGFVAYFIRVHLPSHAFFQIAVITQHPNKLQFLCCKDKTTLSSENST